MCAAAYALTTSVLVPFKHDQAYFRRSVAERRRVDEFNRYSEPPVLQRCGR